MSKSKVGLVALSALAGALIALPAWADSQARIVRLSDVHGPVQIDKNAGMGFENAFLNLPITQGTQIRTGDTGRAEIEFEDGSTLRLAPNTTVQFSALGADDSGKHLSVTNLVEGQAYVNWLSKSDRFTLNFSREKIELERPAHFRVQTSTIVATVGVFKGDVAVTGPAGAVTVGKKKMVTFATSDDDKATVAKNLEEDQLDAWDKEALQYHEQYARNNSSPYGYGASDLSYYGNYTSVPGYGMMWQPYFTGVGWDPFMDGAWSFYPGMGYTFVSAYPWGWLPYRYGNWMFVPGFGWMWQPGAWNSFAYAPRFIGVPPTRFRAPLAPVGTVSTVAVGRGGPIVSAGPPSRVVLNSGSAGMGISRGSLNNLSHLNRQVVKSGAVEVRSTPQFAATPAARSASASSASRSNMGSPSSGSVGSSRGSAPASRASAPAPSRASPAPSSAGHVPPHR